MNFCRYNTHCPICRQLPDGVQTHETSTTLTPVMLRLDGVLYEVGGESGGEGGGDNAVDERRRNWQRYRNRRRRALNNHPHLTTLFDRLQVIRRDISTVHNDTQRAYNQRCRDVWRTDSELAEMRRVLTRLKRRERRIERTLCEQLRDLVGSEP